MRVFCAETLGQLDQQIAALNVDVLTLSECMVNTGWSLHMGSSDVPAIHYNLAGSGSLLVPGHKPIELEPHTLVVLPPNMPFQLQAPDPAHRGKALRVVNGAQSFAIKETVYRYRAGEEPPDLLMICGHFKANFGSALDIFAMLSAPIVEHFGATDRLDEKLRSAMAELIAQEIGSGAMATALLKQVIVALIRRSLRSLEVWAERFSALSDPRIARALAEMVASPSKQHHVETLANNAGMSRSAFMARFKEVVGSSPMTVLRSLRMREAAILLGRPKASLDQIAHDVGYASRTSFLRAFKEAHGCDPSEYKTSH